MTLTQTPASHLIICETIQHSALGIKFIEQLKENFGIHAAACYTERCSPIGVKTHSTWKISSAAKTQNPGGSSCLPSFIAPAHHR